MIYKAYNMRVGIFLGLGSNLGDRIANVKTALSTFLVLRQSSFYETEPVDFLDQPWFINCVVEIDTTLSPMELLSFCQEIEQRMGRVIEIPKGPRIIDVDVLFYDDAILNNPRLTLPHPGIPNRRFVLAPLHEIAPDFVHPVSKQTISELLVECPDTSRVVRIEPTDS